jgi:hypothetical protein
MRFSRCNKKFSKYYILFERQASIKNSERPAQPAHDSAQTSKQGMLQAAAAQQGWQLLMQTHSDSERTKVCHLLLHLV